MSNFQDIKQLVSEFHQELDSAAVAELPAILSRYVADDYTWRGMHPFYEQTGADSVAEVFWQPLHQSFSNIQRRPDIFFAGDNQVDGMQSQWVASMGHLMGLFDQDWLGIPRTRKMAFLPYAEFNKVENGKIVETAFFCDIISIMKQAGLNPLPEQTGAFITTPGPRTHDGLLHDIQDEESGRKTLELITRMCDDLTGADMHSSQSELSDTWHDDMIWFGPSGIGATYTISRYEEQHQGPFNDGLENIVFNGHVARFAEGNYGGWFGWANLSMNCSGDFLGLPASDRPTEMRVVDIYRREGDKLAENWIFIDLLHFLSLQGVNVLERMKKISAT